MDKTVAVIGSGPAGLMAASVAAQAGLRVRLFEKRASAGRKLLIAGSSGLNITYDLPLDESISQFTAPPIMEKLLRQFPPSAWIKFIEDLGIHTFRGTSRRYFIEGMKTPPLLSKWLEALRRQGVEIGYQKECVDFELRGRQVALQLADGEREIFDAAAFCLGGGSWEKTPVRWPEFFREKGLAFADFRPSNIGFRVAWPPAFLAEAEGKPIKNVIVRSARGSRIGDLVVTEYGLEGTPIYFAGEIGAIHLDLKPDLSVEQVERKLSEPKENLSMIRRVKRCLKLSDAAQALVYHLAPLDSLQTIDQMAAYIKDFPLELLGRQPLAEAISSAGGLSWTELDEHLMLRRYPGVFAAGEMIDWDAPTGGFLIQACVSQGYAAGQGMVGFVASHGLVP